MIRLDWIDAYLCEACLKFRHALPWGDPLRPAVVERMTAWTRQAYERRQSLLAP